MHRLKTSISILSFFLLLFASQPILYAQAERPPQAVEASYEVLLQLVVGTNDAKPRAELPRGLSEVSRQLRNNFAFRDYYLVNTYLGRVAHTGNLDYKSVSDILGNALEVESPSFLEWSFANLRKTDEAKSPAMFQFQSFRFGARVPLRTSTRVDEGGRSFPVVNYESIGLNMNRVSLAENAPTIVGSLSLPGTNGTIFLVLTVKPVGN